ncbi:MAG: IclR family transcriptional regulator C-terminal domain-containing protein, partial [Microcella sp.]|nr:IclR family transcriptional regulator C-terminal domain-containing protein [Microcella sp.]
ERRELLQATERRSFTERTIVEESELLAEIQRVADAGWALVDGELEEGLLSIAAPVRNREGAVVAAVNVSSSRSAYSGSQLDVVVAALLRATRSIDDDLRLQ